MPRNQILRAILATMPRNWGFEGLVRGRVIEGRRFQFVFPSEEAMDTVLRRGPWAYADRMLVLQKWAPLMDMAMLNFILFWVQIRGIPLQYMNREVIVHIARVLGDYIQMDYNDESGRRMDFVRVRLNWNVNNRLQFQRNFQFTLGVNTLLRLTYERLRGFCETCGMLTHDSGACLIQNGGPDPDNGDNEQGDDDAEDVEVEMVPNHGVIIEEINDDAAAEGGDDGNEAVGQNTEADTEPVDLEQEEYERNIRMVEEEADDEELWNGHRKYTMFSSDVDRDEMYNPLYPNGQEFPKGPPEDPSLKRKAWLTSTEGNSSMKYFTGEKGESSGTSQTKRKKKNVTEQSEQYENESTRVAGLHIERGAVGPEPPLPP